MIGINPYVIAFTALAGGTSWPDLVASKIAAERQLTADSAIANITCRYDSSSQNSTPFRCCHRLIIKIQNLKMLDQLHRQSFNFDTQFLVPRVIVFFPLDSLQQLGEHLCGYWCSLADRYNVQLHCIRGAIAR